MADRLTDAELESLYKVFECWVDSKAGNALSELIERRAMDAAMLDALRSMIAWLDDGYRSLSDACQLDVDNANEIASKFKDLTQ